MTVSLKRLHALPALFPIPQLDRHVITSSQHERLGRVDDDGANVVWMCLEGCDLLACVIVVDPHLEVIAAADNPVLAGDEAAGSYGDIGELEGLDDRLGLVGPYVDMAAVERCEDLCCISVCRPLAIV